MSRIRSLIFNKTFLIIAVLAVMATVDFSSQQRLSQRIEQNHNNQIVSIPTDNSTVSAENSPSVLGETDTQNSPAVQSVPIDQSLTDRFIQIKGNLGNLGAIIQKNGLFALAPNSVDNTIIARRSIETANLATNSINSRTIENHSIGSTDLKDDIEIKSLAIKDILKVSQIDLGDNSISDGVMSGNWNFGTGNLTTTGVISALGGNSTEWNAKQNAYDNLTSFGTLANSAGYLMNNGSGTFSYSTSGLISGLTSGYVPYATNGTTLANSGIFIASSGNVGIGTTNPGGGLDVTGSIFARTMGLSSDYDSNRIAVWGDSLTQVGLGIQLQGQMPTYNVYNGGISGETSTQIKSRMLAATDKSNRIAVIWAGYNNHASVATVEADIAAMVATIPNPKRFVILGIISGNSDANNSNIASINSYLASTYPDNYIDILAYLLTQGTGTGQDAIDVSNQVVPTSLRVNATVHLTDAGYLLVAQQVKSFVAANFGATTDGKVITYADVPFILKAQPPIESLNIFSGGTITYGNTPLLTALTTSNNYAFGPYAGNFTMTGTGNFAFGGGSLWYNTTGSQNTAMGYGTLALNSTGSSNVSLGYISMNKNTSGSDNIGIGMMALGYNMTGSKNTAIGTGALLGDLISNENTALGYHSLYFTTGSQNTGIGTYAAQSATGNGNTALGFYAGPGITTGGRNTTIGASSGQAINGSSGNVFLGYSSGTYETGSNKLFIDNISRANETDARLKALIYGVFDATVANQKLTLNANVGIGTTSPDTTLKVIGSICASATDVACFGTTAGNIYAANFIVSGTVHLPDYVFDKDYPLLSMNDLQTYIDNNGHLPNVPSADDINKNGLNLSQMVPTLLEKVEENTLYNIDNYNKIETISNDQLVIIGGNKDLQKQMTDLSDEQSVETRLIADLQGEADQNTQDITDLQKQMTDLQTQNQAVIDFAAALEIDSDSNLINFGTWNIAVAGIKAESINLTGDLEAKNVTASDTVKGDNIQGNSLELGKDNSGKDVLAAGDTEVEIDTPATDKDAKIYVTPVGNTFGQVLYIDEISDGAYFKVKMNAAQNDDIKFNWLIVK